jgi:hypothetical protein
MAVLTGCSQPRKGQARAVAKAHAIKAQASAGHCFVGFGAVASWAKFGVGDMGVWGVGMLSSCAQQPQALINCGSQGIKNSSKLPHGKLV